MPTTRLWLAASLLLGLAGCEQRQSQALPPSPARAPVIDAVPTLARLERGARLFQEHCAQCHGPEAQGHPDWQTPGVIAAPPLNGTGNEWKRSRAEIVQVILHGAARDGVPVMPAWKGRLGTEDVNDVIAWFQALWPADVYNRWKHADAGSKP